MAKKTMVFFVLVFLLQAGLLLHAEQPAGGDTAKVYIVLPRLSLANVTSSIYVDDIKDENLVGKISYNQYLAFDVSSGEHKIIIKNPPVGGPGNEIKMNFGPGEIKYFGAHTVLVGMRGGINLYQIAEKEGREGVAKFKQAQNTRLADLQKLPTTDASVEATNGNKLPDLSAYPEITQGRDFSKATVFVKPDSTTVFGFGGKLEELSEGLLVGKDGSFIFGGLLNGQPNGKVLAAKGATTYDGQYNNGMPAGRWQSTSNPDDFIDFTEDTLNLSADSPLNGVLRDIKNLQAQAESTLKQLGINSSQTQDILNKLIERQEDVNKTFGAYNLASQFSSQPMNKTITTPDGLKWSLLALEKHEIVGPNGLPVSIEKSSSAVGTNGVSISLNYSTETLSKLSNPIKHVFLGNGLGAGYFDYIPSIGSLYGLNLGGGVRYFGNRGENMPGLKGGKGKGWDWRGIVDIGFSGSSIVMMTPGASSSQTTINTSAFGYDLKVGGGYSWFTFKPMDEKTLLSAGSGVSVGVYGVLRGSGAGITPTIEPYFSIDKYSYNPGATKYKASSFTIMYMFPLGVALSYMFSF